jgi:hypothetical protein
MRTVEEIQKQIDEHTATRESVAATLRERGFDESLSGMVERLNNRLQELYREKREAQNPPPEPTPIPSRYERDWVI